MTLEEKISLLTTKLQNTNVLRFIFKNTVSNVVQQLNEDQIDEHLQTISNYQTTLSYKIEDAMAFANTLMVEFTTENIVMGITADGMTGHVRKTLAEVIVCLLTGSLYDAILEVKAIPADKKDTKYLTNVRLTTFINKIEDYLLIPRTTVE